MKKYDYIIFDLDNTLLDFSLSETNALKQLFAKYGVIFTEETFSMYKEINHQLWTNLEEGLVKKKTVLETRFSKFFATQELQVDGQQADNEYRQFLEKRNDIMVDALELLEYLSSEGYTLFAGTNGVGRTQRKRLKNAEMTHYFKNLYISEEVGFEKPDVRFFDTIFTHENIQDTSKVLMVGDSLSSDIRGANRVGIDSVWLNLYSDRSEEDRPTYECISLKKMRELMNNYDL